MNFLRRLIDIIKYKLYGERRLFPRYGIKDTDQIKAFFSLDGANAYMHKGVPKALERPRQILNLSKSGVALFLFDEEDVENFKKTSRIPLKLVVEGQMLNLTCEVVYVLEGIKRLGLRFVDTTSEQLEIISKFLDVRFLSSSLEEIPVKRVEKQKHICRWFHGQNNTDLFSWQAEAGEFVHHLIIFVDNAVEWSKSMGARTGRVRRPDFALTYTALFSTEPNPIDFDETNRAEILEKAISIIKLSNIDPNVKNDFLSRLS